MDILGFEDRYESFVYRNTMFCIGNGRLIKFEFIFLN